MASNSGPCCAAENSSAVQAEDTAPTTPTSEGSTSSTDEATTASVEEGDHGDCDDVGAISPTEGDAGPFNMDQYQQRLPPEERDPAYRHRYPPQYPQYLETLSAIESTEYNIYVGTRLAVILNNETFHSKLDLDKRNGTMKDCEAIQGTFRKIGFEVQVYHNPKLHDIRTALSLIQNRSDLSCLAFFILTHGEEDGKLFSHDGPYNLNRDIINELLPEQAKNLAGRPKMIFIQACQGKYVDGGTKLRFSEPQNRSRHCSTDGINQSSTYCIPNYSDFLICQASYHGFYSFRSPAGSWLIQTLCDEINSSSPSDEFLGILTRVLRRVATQKVSNVPQEHSLHNKKQIPLVQFTLMRSVYLKKVQEKVEGGRSTTEPRGKKSVRPATSRDRSEIPKKSTASTSKQCSVS